MDIYFCVGVNTALGIMVLLRLHQIAAELKRQRPKMVTRQDRKKTLNSLHQVCRDQLAKFDPDQME